MKTKNIMLGLLSSAVITIGASSCTNNNDPYTKSDETVERDTVYDTINVDKPVFGVTLHTVCYSGGEYTIEFNPHADWKWAVADKAASWFTINTATGKDTNKKLSFSVAENADIKERTIATVITMDGKEFPMTIKQLPTAPFATIFDSTIILKPSYQDAYVNDIVCNSKLTVVSFPEWIESVELTRYDEMYFGYHSAYVKLKPQSMDDAEREGVIKFKAEGVAEELNYTIKCQEFTEKYAFNDVDKISANPVVCNADKKFNVEILSNPAAPQYTVKIYEAIESGAINQPDTYKDLEPSEIEFAMVASRAAYIGNMLNITVKERTEGIQKKYTVFLVDNTRASGVNKFNIDRMAEPQRLSFYTMPNA